MLNMKERVHQIFKIWERKKINKIILHLKKNNKDLLFFLSGRDKKNMTKERNL